MAILIYAEHQNGKPNKTAKELASYASAFAARTGDQVIALGFGLTEPEELYRYGVHKVLNVEDPRFADFNARAYAEAFRQAADATGASLILTGQTADALYFTPLLAGLLQSAYVTQVIDLPESVEPFTVKRKAFSNKAIAHVVLKTPVKILNLAKNSFGLRENAVEGTVETFAPQVDDGVFEDIKRVKVEKASGKVPLSDAEIIVSGGRGLKGPENWGMIEELAEVLGAATACSKPVADMGWRPHSEHVGQTGKQVAPNLYIAIGISGAIQHLAGVNSSKNILVINIDPEAPFFKAADYGVVGDAFEVVPALIEKLKKFKLNS
ncbi:MAG: electron transfer flavoprotein subunit alpha/FixB family protein [Chlorobi bacterium]|nr:electron transfer flavoprotein subunit alpha/FixB family protein [Chlorobiota bacterium]